MLRQQHVDKIALVTEGGGQRGIFTAGVLDAFLRADFNPFDLLIGTSAGSIKSGIVYLWPPRTRLQSDCRGHASP